MFNKITIYSLFLLINKYTYSLLNPVFPNNIVCFPERDFCTVEKYIEYTNQYLTLNVINNNEIMGSVKGLVSGADIAFEVNHPGGLCWGDNTNLLVTPDIKIGNKIELKKDNLLLSEIEIQNGYITSKEIINNNLIIKGYLDPLINKNNIEIRIVNPDFKTTIITRRDIRAIYGPIISNANGYSSGIDIDSDNILTSTFIFNDLTLNNLAMDGALSLSMWQSTDSAGNPSGITISEFGELGGPYSAICPQYANMITNLNLNKIIVFNNEIKWDKNIALLPGTDPLTNFNINIIRNIDVNTDLISGYRLSASLDYFNFNDIGIKLTDKIEFRAMTNNKFSGPIIIELNDLHDSVSLIMTPPSGNTDSVILSSNTGQIIYTIDDTEPSLTNGIIYDNGIKIDKEIKIKAIALSYNGKKSTIVTQTYSPVVIQKIYIIPSGVIVNIISNGLLISWDNINDPTLNLYKINIYNNNILINSIETTFNPYTIKNLESNNKYQFTLSAKYDTVWSEESIKTSEIIFPNPVDNIIVSSIRYKSTDFRVTGTTSLASAILTLYYVNPDNSISVNTINIANTNNPIRATASAIIDATNNYPFDIRVTKNQVPANPLKLYIKSSGGGISGPHII